MFDEKAIESAKPQDATKLIFERQREALQVLFPTPDELEPRLSLITILRGRAPDMNLLYQAMVEWEGLLAMEQGRDLNWEGLTLDFLKAHAPSLGGRARQQAVDIARAAPPIEHRRSLADMLRGR